MVIKVRGKDLFPRLTNHLALTYMTLISVMKSVVLANAAYSVFLMINNGNLNMTTATFWLASFLSMILIYQAFTIGVIIIAWIPTVRDILLPFAVGITEFLMFSVLTDPNTLVHWHLMFSLFSVAAFFAIWNVIRETKLSNYERSLHALVNKYITSQKTDRIMAFLTAIVWLVIWIVMQSFPSLQQYQWISGVAAVAIMLVAIYFDEHDRHLIAQGIMENTN